MYSLMKRLKVTDLPTYYQHLLDLVSHNPDRKEFTSELKKLFSDVFYNLEIVSRDRKKLEVGERFFDERDLDKNGNPIEKIRIKHSETFTSTYQVKDTENCIEYYLEKVDSIYQQIEQLKEDLIDYIKEDVNHLDRNQFDYTKQFCVGEYKKFVNQEEN